MPIPTSKKSVLVAWLRTAFVLGGGLLVIFAFARLLSHDRLGTAACVISATLAVTAFFYSYQFSPICRASYGRAMELARLADLQPEEYLALEIHYGRISAQQAEQELIRIYERAQDAHSQRPLEQDEASASSENAGF